MLLVSSFTQCSVCCGQGCQSFCFFFLCRGQCINILIIVLETSFMTEKCSSSSSTAFPRNLSCCLPVRSSWCRISSSGNCIFKACSNWSSWYLFPVAASIMFLSLASSPLFWKKTRQVAVQETEEVLPRNPQYAVLVFHSMGCPSLSSRNSNSNWTMCWNLHPNCRPFHHFFWTSLGPVPWLFPL